VAHFAFGIFDLPAGIGAPAHPENSVDDVEE
jgi:hypothetical protein